MGSVTPGIASGFDTSHRLPEQQLTALLEAARWSPSANNAQPWLPGDLAEREVAPRHRRPLADLILPTAAVADLPRTA